MGSHGRMAKVAGIILVLSTLMLTTGGFGRAAPASSPRHGGTIMVSDGTPLTTIDPAFTYGAPDWPQTHAIFSALLDFDNGTGVVPNVAASLPTLSSDGLTYTFHLRHGVTFSNGDPVTAQDFIYSWERELAPKTASPLTYLWVQLKGAAAYEAGKAAHISGISAPDQSTLKAPLPERYPAFIYIFGIPCSMVVDPKVIHQYHAENKDFGVHAVGSGPFILKDWVQGQQMELVRNPTYFRAGLPYVDGVHIALGVDNSVGLLKLEKGQVDLLGDVIPSAQFPSVIANPALKAQISTLTDIGVYMIAMNTKVKPFTDIRVRQAVAYALSKQRALRFINGRGVAGTGILPPGLPGFAGRNIPDPFPYNPTKAKQLLAQAGFPNGFTTTMGVPTSPNEQRMADAAIYDLQQIGIKVNIKPTVTEGTAVATMPMQAYHWLMDYPDPADFVDGFTSCASAVPGGSNVAFYCNPKVDALANVARGMATGPVRVTAYLHIDQLIANDAMSVPMFYDVYYYIHSKRIQNYTVHPMWAPFAFDRYWLSS